MLAASTFHDRLLRIADVKAALAERGIPSARWPRLGRGRHERPRAGLSPTSTSERPRAWCPRSFATPLPKRSYVGVDERGVAREDARERRNVALEPEPARAVAQGGDVGVDAGRRRDRDRLRSRCAPHRRRAPGASLSYGPHVVFRGCSSSVSGRTHGDALGAERDEAGRVVLRFALRGRAAEDPQKGRGGGGGSRRRRRGGRPDAARLRDGGSALPLVGASRF